MSSADRRRHRRYVLQVEAALSLGPGGAQARGTLMDLSAGGAMFTAPRDGAWEPAVGSGAYIAFRHRDALCEGTGQVVRLVPFGQQHGVAVDFIFANEELYDLIQEIDNAPAALRPDILEAIEELEIQLS